MANVGLSLRDGWIDTARESISALPRGLGVIRMGPIFCSLQGEDLARPEKQKYKTLVLLCEPHSKMFIINNHFIMHTSSMIKIVVLRIAKSE